MQQILYIMQFKGGAVPVGGSSGNLKATSSASSCSITTIVDDRGVRGTLQPATGGTAAFESDVTMTGEDSFLESGTITFGKGAHRLRFSTVGQGYIGPSADSKLRHGTVTWRVDGGEGQFAGASGLITSNFTVGEAGEVVDNHFGLIFVK